MHYACIVGVNHEWPEQRKELGDIGLARCLKHHCHLSKENLLEIYDQRATGSRVLYSLEELMNVRNKNKTDDDVLLLYYGGHGKREEACTFIKSTVDGKVQEEPWLRYDEILQLIETHFEGGTVWAIVDCCHSGGFGEALMERYRIHNTNISYGCVMSVPPTDIAGMEWTMTECFIRAFKGELLCGKNAAAYLSTKKGKHRISINVPQKVSNDNETAKTLHYGVRPTWEEVIEFLADEMARIKGDQLTTLFCGKKVGAFLKQPCMFGGQCVSEELNDSNQLDNPSRRIPRDLTWMKPFVKSQYFIDDEVYIKCIGSAIKNGALREDHNFSHWAIGWLPGRIVSVNDDVTCVEAYNIVTDSRQTIEISIDDTTTQQTIMSGLPFGFHMDPHSCVAAITHFARQLCYLDTSLHPFTHLKILWSDGKYYPGRVMSRIEINWDQLKEHKVDDYNKIGPYVAVQWEEEDTASFVPRAMCVVVDPMAQRMSKKELAKAQKSQDESNRYCISTPLDAMLASLRHSGKQLHPEGEPILNGITLEQQESSDWEAYDAEDKSWFPVQVMNSHVSKLPLQVLAYHVLYQTGNLSVVFWEEDSVLSLISNSFLRLRSDECKGSAESGSSSEVDQYFELNVNEFQCSLPTADSWWKRYMVTAHLGLLAASCCTGYLIGKRSKPS